MHVNCTETAAFVIYLSIDWPSGRLVVKNNGLLCEDDVDATDYEPTAIAAAVLKPTDENGPIFERLRDIALRGEQLPEILDPQEVSQVCVALLAFLSLGKAHQR